MPAKRYQPQIPGYYFNPSYDSSYGRTLYQVYDVHEQFVIGLDDANSARVIVNHFNKLYNVIDKLQLQLTEKSSCGK